PQETRDRLDAVIEFAELGDFVDLKLKNYSSGMLVRLAFSVMMQADADILLIDEVLAVGDAAFQQKCADAFQEMKAAGKTIILVTHEMTTVERYCHRAMLIDGGKIRYIGDPAEVGRRYLRLNFERDVEGRGTPVSGESEDVRLLDAWLEDPEGRREPNVEHGEGIKLRFELEALRDLPGLGAGYSVANADGVNVFQSGAMLSRPDGSGEIAAGERVRLEIDLENLLLPGRYFVHLGINLSGEQRVSLYVHNAADFVVYGGEEALGIVALPARVGASFGAGAEQ
ncbi:MAG TPA: Wzt carbohydrate-binding domain-containing protein, partial [Solirubrobacterales bacterium]|nr:Wzt carbohydrate-binding domain-containing protein [Solirubrobacterales bacterium]